MRTLVVCAQIVNGNVFRRRERHNTRIALHAELAPVPERVHQLVHLERHDLDDERLLLRRRLVRDDDKVRARLGVRVGLVARRGVGEQLDAADGAAADRDEFVDVVGVVDVPDLVAVFVAEAQAKRAAKGRRLSTGMTRDAAGCSVPLQTLGGSAYAHVGRVESRVEDARLEASGRRARHAIHCKMMRVSAMRRDRVRTSWRRSMEGTT